MYTRYTIGSVEDKHVLHLVFLSSYNKVRRTVVCTTSTTVKTMHTATRNDQQRRVYMATEERMLAHTIMLELYIHITLIVILYDNIERVPVTP